MSENDWIRVERDMPCPICGRPDWCLLHQKGKKVICSRVRSTTKVGQAGWIHKVNDNGLKKHKKPHQRKSNTCLNWERTSELYERKMNGERRIKLLQSLGIQGSNVTWDYQIGWDGEAYTIPAYNGEGDMCGIMRRWPDGKKMWVPRSRNGLFIPAMKSIEGNVSIAEGFSDASSLTDLGFRAIGRANCQTGVGYIKRWLYKNKKVSQVTIVSDNDMAGQAGATSLARELYGGRCGIMMLDVPPQYKDVRQWITENKINMNEVVARCRKL